MGLNSVALDLLLLIHPMSAAQAEDQVLSSSRQDLKNDMQELESAGFLKPCKDTPDSWEFAQVIPWTYVKCMSIDTGPKYKCLQCFGVCFLLRWEPQLLKSIRDESS